MDISQAKALTRAFLTIYAWQFAYVNQSWWAWSVDEGHWDWMGVTERMSKIFTLIAEDIYPENLKLRGQMRAMHQIKLLMGEMRPILASAVLPCSPQPGSRVPGSQ